MKLMFATLDVSKISGWSNANASCRVERRGYATRDEVRAGRREGVVWRRCKRRARGDLDLRGGAQGICGAHEEHPMHVWSILDVWKHARRGPD